MHSISTFFTTLWRSATDLSFYRTFKKKFWSGFWYIYWLSVLLMFVSGAVVAVQGFLILPKVDPFIAMVEQSLDEFYPPELEIVIQTGALSTNVQTPFAMDVPESARAYFKMENPQHLVVIDPDARVEDFPSMNTVLLLTRTSAVYPDSQGRQGGGEKSEGLKTGQYRVISFNRDEDISIDRVKYDTAVAAVSGFFPYVKPLLIGGLIVAVTVLPFIGGFFSVAIALISLVFSTLVLWILSLMLGVPGGYVRVYLLSMYALTASTIYGSVQVLLHFRLPFVHSLLFWVWMIVILVALRPKEKVVAAKKSVRKKKV
ncbi:MAG: DUF1189 family protein [Candidatus Peribacteraceae bacterium]|nr:DUF1189 family protein [Candidatus Peribacteraceae bacterium]